MTLEFSQQIFKKSSNITRHENSSSESEVVLCVWMDRYTDRHDEANITFRNFANESKNLYK